MKYYNGLNDIVFKNTLCVEEHKGLLKWLLESCLDIKIDNLILKDKELSKKTKYSKGRVVDLLIESDNKMFNVEINNRPHDYNNDRNLGYLANLYGKSIDKSNDYKKINSCIQLNITSGKKDIELKSKYLLVDTLNESKNIWTDNFIIYEINVDLLKKLYYNKDIKSINKYKPVIMLTLNKEELEEFSLGDERIMEYKDKVNELNSDDDFVTFISREEDQEKTENALRTIISEKNEELKNSREELRNSKEELKNSKEELKTQKTKLNNVKIDIARNLKENNIDIKIISDTTGLTIEEIEKL